MHSRDWPIPPPIVYGILPAKKVAVERQFGPVGSVSLFQLFFHRPFVDPDPHTGDFQLGLQRFVSEDDIAV